MSVLSAKQRDTLATRRVSGIMVKMLTHDREPDVRWGYLASEKDGEG